MDRTRRIEYKKTTNKKITLKYTNFILKINNIKYLIHSLFMSSS